MVSPVAGLRPSRAFRSDFTSFPNPGRTNSPFDFTSRAARLAISSKNSFTCARFIPVDSEKWLITSDWVMRFLPVAALVAIVWLNTSNENWNRKTIGLSYITLKPQSLQEIQHFTRFFEEFPANRLARVDGYFRSVLSGLINCFTCAGTGTQNVKCGNEKGRPRSSPLITTNCDGKFNQVSTKHPLIDASNAAAQRLQLLIAPFPEAPCWLVPEQRHRQRCLESLLFHFLLHHLHQSLARRWCKPGLRCR